MPVQLTKNPRIRVCLTEKYKTLLLSIKNSSLRLPQKANVYWLWHRWLKLKNTNKSCKYSWLTAYNCGQLKYGSRIKDLEFAWLRNFKISCCIDWKFKIRGSIHSIAVAWRWLKFKNITKGSKYSRLRALIIIICL